MTPNELQYKLRQAVFNLLLKALSPFLPWLSRQPWAWRLKAAFFHVGSGETWLNHYGPEWDAPSISSERAAVVLADLRDAAPSTGESLLTGLESLVPPPARTFSLGGDMSALDLAAQLAEAMRPETFILILTTACLPHRLLTAHYAAAAAAHPEVRLWYSDEVQNLCGGGIKIFCKPAWDPLYYRHSGYVGQCFALRGDLVADILAGMKDDVPPKGLEWCDRALNLMKNDEPVGHLPVPLYSMSADFFPAPRRCPEFEIISGARPKVSLVIPFKDRPDLLRPCLDTLLGTTDYPEFEIILVDNGSRDEELLAFLAGPLDGRIKVLSHDIPFNFSALVNHGVAAATGEVVVLLNNDITIISPNWLGALVDWAVRPPVGVVGAKLLYPNGLIQHGGMFSGVGVTLSDGLAPPGLAHVGWPGDSEGYFGLLASPRVMSSVAGAVLAVRRDLYEDLGGFDEKLAVAMNDVDFCLKARQSGLACVWAPESVLIHHESASRKMDRVSTDKMSRLMAEWALMRQRWGAALGGDPWYSPNLSPESGYELVSPPKSRQARLAPSGSDLIITRGGL